MDQYWFSYFFLTYVICNRYGSVEMIYQYNKMCFMYICIQFKSAVCPTLPTRKKRARIRGVDLLLLLCLQFSFCYTYKKHFAVSQVVLNFVIPWEACLTLKPRCVAGLQTTPSYWLDYISLSDFFIYFIQLMANANSLWIVRDYSVVFWNI